MLEIKKLSKKYDDLIIDDLSVVFPNVGMVVIIGDSGCGKTTLLNIIGGIDRDYMGEIYFDHQNIKGIKHYCRKHIGFVFQSFNLINWLNVNDNYMLPKYFTKTIFSREIDDRKEKLDLTKITKKKVKILSGGQRQRVAMLRAMIKNVDILLCDEPTGSLDTSNAQVIFDLLKIESKERLVIVITHDESLASKYGDYVYTLKNGKLIGNNGYLEDNHFYCRLKARKSPLNLCKLALLQYKSNFMRNIKITSGVMMALLCIMLTFTLSDSLQNQVKKQITNIFPSQLVSVQARNKNKLYYDDLMKLKSNQDVTYVYGEMQDYEFMGISLDDNYNMDKTVYISDMTKELKESQIEVGRKIKDDYEVVISKTTAMHMDKDYQKLLNENVYGFYLSGDVMKKIKLKVVGISKEKTVFDTMYLSELANIKHVERCFDVDIKQIPLMIAMVNIDNKIKIKDSVVKLNKDNPSLKFKMASEDISDKIDDLLGKVEMVLVLFSSLAIIAACFLIGEVLYLSVVEKTKDVGIFRCLGASKSQLRLLVLLESFIIISTSYILSIIFFKEMIMVINQLITIIIQLDVPQGFVQIDNSLLLLIYLGAIIFGFISSYFPAHYASSIDPVKALKFQRY